MKKVLTLLLALVMLLSTLSLAACGDKNKGDDTFVSTEEQNNTLGGDSEDDSTVLGLPGGLKFNDVFKVLVWKAWVDEFGTTPFQDGDDVERAMVERDKYVEGLLGIEFEYTQADGNYEHRNEFINLVSESVMVTNKTWDLICGYSMCPPQLAMQDLLVDLGTVDYIDFTKAWYPEFMVDACTIDGKTYSITGDISTNSLYAMQGVAFSASAAAENGLNEDDLYQMVYDNEWTIEKMFEITQDLARSGSDGIWDETDFYPIVTSNEACIDSFYFSAGLKMIEENEEGVLQVSGDVMSETAMDIYSILYSGKTTYKNFATYYNEMAIQEGQCIFSISPVINFRVYWADSNEAFRILPFPKYQKEDAYQTYLSMWCSQYCIPGDIDDPDRSAAVMEALGYANYHTVTPVIFEETMKLRYSENPDCAAMFDIMRNGRTYDIASLFGIAFEGKGYSGYAFMRYMVLEERTDWVSSYKNDFESNLNRVTNDLNQFFSK